MVGPGDLGRIWLGKMEHGLDRVSVGFGMISERFVRDLERN